MKSLLFSAVSPFVIPPGCGPSRTEVVQVLRKNGRLYRVVMRDKIVVEDPYLVMVKATAFALQQGETYPGTPPARGIRDFLVKTNIQI
jgi:hypothetical protein